METTQSSTDKDTKLVNPPKGQTKMVSPQKKGQEKYKVVALREFNIGGVIFKDGKVAGDTTRLVKKGDIIEVDKVQARDLCQKISGSYAFSGERHIADGDAVRHDLTRARLALPADFVDKEPLTPLTDDGDVLSD